MSYVEWRLLTNFPYFSSELAHVISTHDTGRYDSWLTGRLR